MQPRTVECVRAGKVASFKEEAVVGDLAGAGDGTVTFTIPLGAVDVVMVRP